MLGAIFAIFSAATFALNNVAARRGVITGTPTQGMAVTIPVGLAGFVLSGALAGYYVLFVEKPETQRVLHDIDVELTSRKGRVFATSSYSEPQR